MRKQTFRPMPAFTEPLAVSVVDGEVVISGPEWLHASLEPSAARTSSDRLAIAAEQASADRVAADTTKPKASKRNANRRKRDESHRSEP